MLNLCAVNNLLSVLAKISLYDFGDLLTCSGKLTMRL